MERLDKLAAVARLLDLYGQLLTERQRQALTMFYEEDLSLAEIAGQTGASRQAAHDLIHRGEALLLRYENALGLAAEAQRRQSAKEELLQAVAGLSLPEAERKRLLALVQAI